MIPGIAPAFSYLVLSLQLKLGKLSFFVQFTLFGVRVGRYQTLTTEY